MPCYYAIEETLPDGSTLLWPVPNTLALAPSGFLGLRHPTWLSATAHALELMKKSGWTREMRAACTSIHSEDDD